jgi:hypothetical protein
VFYIKGGDNSNEDRKLSIGPQYPSLKLDVSYYQKEAIDIMEESIEEKRLASVSMNESKIKRRLSQTKKNEEANAFKIQIEEDHIS